LEGVLKFIKISNEFVDLKMKYGEGTSKQKPFRPFHKKGYNQDKLPESSNLNLNLEVVGMDHFYT
jgi:hypothetical protein